MDGSDPHYRNWMYFIQYARHQDEQNLMAIQHEERVYFRAVRDIQLGEELLVWYDKYQYDLYMGIPQGFKDSSSAEERAGKQNCTMYIMLLIYTVSCFWCICMGQS